MSQYSNTDDDSDTNQFDSSENEEDVSNEMNNVVSSISNNDNSNEESNNMIIGDNIAILSQHKAGTAGNAGGRRSRLPRAHRDLYGGAESADTHRESHL